MIPFVSVLASVLLAAAPALPDKGLLIAHRGESLEAPANGLEAFRLAFDDGFGVAFEVALSPEGLVLTRPSPKAKPCGLDEALALVPADARIAFTTADDRGKVAALVRAALGRHPQIRMENVILPGEADLPFANAPDEVARLIADGAKAVLSDSPRRILTLWEEAFSEPPAKEPGTFRMMVFNIWGPFFGNPVGEREDGVVATVRREMPDVVSFQETTPEWWASGLMGKLSSDYGIVEGGWERENRHHNPNPILYRKDLFDVVASGRELFHFKLDYSKGFTWAILREKATKRCFTAFSTHFWWRENGKESDIIRLGDAQQLLHGFDRIWTIQPAPVIGGGDFNAKLGSDALEFLFSRGFSDAQQVAKVASPVTSWHDYPVRDRQRRYRGFVPRRNVAADQSLDHVIAGTGIEVLRHRIVRHPTAMDVSDHSPVVVDFMLKDRDAKDRSCCPLLADSLEVRMLPGEGWWGLCNNFGRDMPFTENSNFACDLRSNNYGHQTLSLLVSSKGRAIWCEEPVKVEIRSGGISLRSDRGRITLIENAGSDLRGALRYAAREFYRPTGEEPELLYFAAPQYNTWIELTYHQNEADILRYAQSMVDHGLPPGVFMIDDTWQAGYGDWRFEPSRFPDPKGMVAKLHGMGFKVLLWMCPFVSMDTPAFRRVAWGRNPDDVRGYPTKGGFLSESREPGWFGAPYPAAIRWWNGCSALLDFTHPNAVAWFGEQLDGLKRDYGVDGFKFDGGSVAYYAGTVDTSGEGGSAPRTFAHDPTASAVRQSALYGEFALKHRGSEYRNVFGFAGKPVIMRLHDKPHTWEALQRVIPDMLAAGFVGIPFICPDMVGGGEWSTFIPGAPFSEELFVRSAQVQALCPMMQISASPWRYLDAGHQAMFKAAVALRQRFAPAFVQLAKRAARDGEPIMRNLEYAYPNRGYSGIRDEFLMGEDLLVAPVVTEGATSRTVEIPPGRWIADDGTSYEGPRRITVSAPLSRLPHFRRDAAKDDR